MTHILPLPRPAPSMSAESGSKGYWHSSEIFVLASPFNSLDHHTRVAFSDIFIFSFQVLSNICSQKSINLFNAGNLYVNIKHIGVDLDQDALMIFHQDTSFVVK